MALSSFVYSPNTLSGCDSLLVEYVFATLDLCESYLWLLDYALRIFLINVFSGYDPLFVLSKVLYLDLVPW